MGFDNKVACHTCIVYRIGQYGSPRVPLLVQLGRLVANKDTLLDERDEKVAVDSLTDSLATTVHVAGDHLLRWRENNDFES